MNRKRNSRPRSLVNRKRHTFRKRCGSWLTTLTLGFLCATCAPAGGPSSIPRARIVPAQSQPSASPTIDYARRLASAADIHGARAADRVGSAKSGLGESHTEIQSLVTEVMRLRKQKTASENELLALYNRLVEQEKKTRLLVKDITEAETALMQERELRAQVSDKLAEAEQQVAAKDAEATQLRGQLSHSESVADAYAKSADDNARLAQREAGRADRAEGGSKLKTKIIVGLSLALLASLVGIYFLSKKRFPFLPF